MTYKHVITYTNPTSSLETSCWEEMTGDDESRDDDKRQEEKEKRLRPFLLHNYNLQKHMHVNASVNL